jgi:low affinity Fe/Cu permease
VCSHSAKDATAYVEIILSISPASDLVKIAPELNIAIDCSGCIPRFNHIVIEHAGFGGKDMSKSLIEVKDRTVRGYFGRFATVACTWFGSTWAFVGAGAAVIVWGAAGPILHFSQIWAQVINTGMGIATFLMVFLIQNTQNRDARAINLKLNELIRAMGKARNQMIDIEKLSDLELDEMQTTYEKIKTGWTERQKRTTAGPAEK